MKGAGKSTVQHHLLILVISRPAPEVTPVGLLRFPAEKVPADVTFSAKLRLTDNHEFKSPSRNWSTAVLILVLLEYGL